MKMKLTFSLILCFLGWQCIESCETNAAGELITTHYHHEQTNSSVEFIIECSQKELQSIPFFVEELNVTAIHLDHNSIKEVLSNIFINVSTNLEILGLSHNNIHILHDKAFSNLCKLKILKLGHNRLCLPQAYPDGIFQDLKELHTLYTLGNKCFHSEGITMMCH